MNHQKNASSGFTLLEVVIAVAIIVTGFFAVYSLNLRSMSASEVVRFYIKAPQLAQMKIADLDGNLKDSRGGTGDFGEEYPGYTWKIDESDVKSDLLGQAAANVKKFDIQIILNGGEDSYDVTVYRYIVSTKL